MVNDERCWPVLAIDIGGTKVAAALVDRSGCLLDEGTIATPGGQPSAALTSVLSWVRDFLAGRCVAGVGVALPAVTCAGRVQWVAPTLPGWGELHLAEEIGAAVGAPAWCEFDGYAAVQGEVWCGAACGSKDAATLIVGTGIGAGVVCNGHVVRGGVGVAGSLGWMRFPCGDHGLGLPVESYASGVGLLRRACGYQEHDSIPFATTNEVFDAAACGDTPADRAVREASVGLASVVLAILSMFAPEVVVLSGGVGSRVDMCARVRQLIADSRHAFGGAETTLPASTLRSASSLYGAAYFAYAHVASS